MIERQNYLDIRAFLEYRERVLQNDPATIRRTRGSLKHLLIWADSTPFERAQTIKNTFPAYLLTARNDGKDKQLAPASLGKACTYARLFFQWARIEIPTRYRDISEAWIETIHPRKSKGAQSIYKKRDIWELADVEKIAALKPQSLAEKRDQAAICFLYLSGMRITAFCTLPIDCVNIAKRRIEQLPEKGVMTKNRKAAVTSLLPIDSLLEIVREWDSLIRDNLPGSALWYPRLGWEGQAFDLAELDYKTPTGRRAAMIEGMKRLCQEAGISYKSPHKLRHGHAVWGLKHSKTIEQMKAVSQNLMHKNLGITDSIYAMLSPDDVAASLSGLGQEASQLPGQENPPDNLRDMMDEILRRLPKKE